MSEHISLRLNWDEVDESTITEVLGLNSRTLNNGCANWDRVAICIGDVAVLVTVEPDTDQVIVTRAAVPNGPGWKSIPSFEFAIGKTLGWCWIGINSQGYKDSFTLAFGGDAASAIDPRCTFVAVASSLWCYDLVQHST